MTNEQYYELIIPYRDALNLLMARLDVLNHSIYSTDMPKPIHNTQSRIKTKQSIEGKLQRKGMNGSVVCAKENLRDIAGIRVICSFQEDIYFLASCLLGQDDVFLIEKKDYIANPKPNGYRSLHLIVETPIFLGSHKRMMKVEVQLRTIAMDFWASLEHKLKYKKNLEIEQLTQELKECADESANLDAKMDAIRKRIEQLKQDGEEEKSWKEKR